MSVFHIKQGKDLKIKGKAEKKIVDVSLPPRVAMQPSDFRGIKARLNVQVGDSVKVGTPLFEDKSIPEVKVVSPASGTVTAINRGEKRALMEIVVETDGAQETIKHPSFSHADIQKMLRKDIIKHLLEGGVWPCIRQRPFSKVANPNDHPKSIFIQAINTEPLALEIDTILNGQEKEFQLGLDIIQQLTDGEVHLCHGLNDQSRALTQAQNVTLHQFSGPHPAGNVSTHIHYIDPIFKGQIIWYIRAEDVLRIAHLFLKGEFSAQRYVAITGEGAKNRVYAKSVIGAPIAHLVEGDSPFGVRSISGSVLTGRNVGPQGYLCFYDSQITIIPEGGEREVLGWIRPGLSKYSFSSTFLSSFFKSGEEFSLDADENGGHRAIILNHLYDQYVPLDIMTYFLVKAVISGDIEEAEKLGILECDEEDFALCTFACPSKMDIGVVIRDGLDLIEREG